MYAELKDREKLVYQAMRALGYEIKHYDVELILNLYTIIYQGNHGNETTLKDIDEMKQCVKGLYEGKSTSCP